MMKQTNIRFEQVPEEMPAWLWRLATWLDEALTWLLGLLD